MLLQNGPICSYYCRKNPVNRLTRRSHEAYYPGGASSLPTGAVGYLFEKLKTNLRSGSNVAEAEDTSTDETLLVDSPLQQDAEYSDSTVSWFNRKLSNFTAKYSTTYLSRSSETIRREHWETFPRANLTNTKRSAG